VTPRRDVRPTSDFYRDLEQRLGPERGPRGEPSRIDFETYELVAILERFGSGWDDLPRLVPGRDDYRVLISTGALVWVIVVHGQLAPDGVVELVRLRIDLTGPPHPSDPPDDD
jgi:hypothetical protein